MKNKVKPLLSIILLISSACSMRLTDFTVISTKNSNVQVNKMQRVEGKDCAHILLGFIPITGNIQPNLKEAIDKAIEKDKADLLLDGVIYSKFFGIPPFLYSSCYVVEGTLANTNR